MYKYHFDIKIKEKNNHTAGSKATEDCKVILLDMGFKNLEIWFNKTPLLLPYNLIKLLATLLYFSIIIKPGSFIIVQYPLKGINKYFNYFIKFLKKKKCLFACIIHDLDCLRSSDQTLTILKEINNLNAYDAVISHNPGMSKWLRANGYKGKVEEINLFDYLVENLTKKEDQHEPGSKKVVFAGNLGRGNFLPKLIKTNPSFFLKLYGPGFNENGSSYSNLKWYGSFSPDKVVKEISGDFGLIWDGESIEDLEGIMGNYMRINSPHKTSLYLAAGIPVIISSNAALAQFVLKNNIGICINNLSEIASGVLSITAEEYKTMKENVLLIGKKLAAGFYFRQAVAGIQSNLYHE